MDVVSYLLGKNAGGGGGGDSKFDEYVNTTITENPASTGARFSILKKPIDVYVSDNVTSLSRIFYESGETYLPRIHCNNNVININNMYYYATNMESLDLSNMYADKIVNAGSAFMGCKKLKYLDIRNIEFDESYNLGAMFGGSSSNGPSSDCEIIVKNETVKQAILESRPDLTNIKTVAEL